MPLSATPKNVAIPPGLQVAAGGQGMSACMQEAATYPVDVVKILALTDKGSRNEVNVVGDAPLHQVLLILLGQCGQVNDHAWQVHVLALSASQCMISVSQ